MKIKNGFIVSKVSDDYLVVAVGEQGKDFKGMIRLNETGAWLWERLKENTDFDTLVADMLAAFEGLTRDVAEKDLTEFLENIAPALEK